MSIMDGGACDGGGSVSIMDGGACDGGGSVSIRIEVRVMEVGQ